MIWNRAASGGRRSASRFPPALFVILPALLFGFGCGDDDDDDANPIGPATDLRTELGLESLPAVIYPADNPPMQERIALGRLLFFDPILSGHLDVSCATCHHPAFGFGDRRQLSVGVSGSGLGPDRMITDDNFHLIPRNSPTIWNVACNINEAGEPDQDGFLFHDGRARGLEDQASKPIASRVEMRGDAYAQEDALDSVIARLQSIDDYVDRFAVAFPGELLKAPAEHRELVVDSSTYARAIAAYERELVAGNSPYDRYVLGDDTALNDIQLEGLELFFGDAKCGACHSGPMLGDFQFRVIGVPQIGPGKEAIPGDDAGRMEHTGEQSDKYAFRTLSLRNVEITPPYMHDGFFNSLDEVVRFHNDGAQPRHTEVSDAMLDTVFTGPLGLSDDEIHAIVQFMRSLTDPGTMVDPYLLTVPHEVPSGLMPVFGLPGPGVGKRGD